VRNWFQRKRTPETPAISSATIGGVAITSGSLLIVDPTYFYEPVQIEGIPPGRVPVEADIIQYPEGGRHIKEIAIRFRPGQVESRRVLGQVGVDSASVVLLDAATYQQFWQEVGPERIGLTSTPDHHRRVAELIRKKFGLKFRELSIIHSQFLDPISEEMETRIVAFLKTFPEYEKHTFMYFRIESGDTFQTLQRAMAHAPWCEMVLDEASGANLVAVTSGFGDGSYLVEGLHGSQDLLGVEIEFIGATQDKVLESFPHLRGPGGDRG
jgi:hypothetical protein